MTYKIKKSPLVRAFDVGITVPIAIGRTSDYLLKRVMSFSLSSGYFPKFSKYALLFILFMCFSIFKAIVLFSHSRNALIFQSFACEVNAFE